jgi:hypothetical protein
MNSKAMDAATLVPTAWIISIGEKLEQDLIAVERRS